ncbi:MAG: hypothetical protein SR2Q5_02080 [Quinella sp. 2Q5]|nr:hypothetical protein [Quinella sp. 2Q5]
MIYLLFAAAVVSLVVLYKFLPTRKIFLVICTVMVAVFGASAFIHGQQVQREQITRERMDELLERQKIFGEWYAAYQKDIDRLDRNWQLYHNILDGLNATDADSFNAEALYLRLKELEQESIDEQLKIHMLTAPQNIGRENRRLVEEIIRKTQRYVDAQTQTISMSAFAAKDSTDADLDALKLKLNDIMIRQSPEGLFTAQEISAIRAALGD